MAGGPQARKSAWRRWELAVIIALLGVIAFSFYYNEHVNPPPDVEDVWMPVMEAYSEDGVECHVAVVDRILRMSEVVRPSPYVDDDLHPYHATRQARELAVSTVLKGDWRPPECGGAVP